MNKYNVLYQIKSLTKEIARKFLCPDREIIEKKNDDGPIPTPTQMNIMEYILEGGKEEVYQKDLEKVLGLTRATVSGVLQTMEKNGLIERVTDEQDTRAKKIVLNQRTKEIFIKNEKRIDGISKIVIEGISQEDLQTFSKVIEKMKQNIDAYNS